MPKIQKNPQTAEKTQTIRKVARRAEQLRPLPEKKQAIKVKSHSKQGIVFTMLQRSQGATVDEMAEATGWQRHSVYGLLYGTLKRQGISLTKADEQRGLVYRAA